jgi:hypothetical protein
VVLSREMDRGRKGVRVRMFMLPSIQFGAQGDIWSRGSFQH